MEKYEKYLEIIDSYLVKFFEQQSPYIFCQKGCSICCEDGEYPFSKIEFNYIMNGYSQLPENVKGKIKKNIDKLKKKKAKSKKENFSHKCPFLIEKSCSLYKYRALVCRSYGLAAFYYTKDGKKKYKLPCCVKKGLNYSSVFDKKEGIFTTQKWKASGIEIEPVSYNVSLQYLLDNELTQYLNLDLKEQKVLMDWFE